MAQIPTPGGGPNQTLLELIFALKGLAQTIEYYHQDLIRRLDEEAKSRRIDLEALRVLADKNNQALTTIPITFADRVEKIVDNLETEIKGQLGDVEHAVDDVKSKLWDYSRSAERAISQNEGTPEPIEEEKADITGKIEVDQKGDIKLQVSSKLLKKIWYAVIVMATGGGAYGFVKMIKAIFE